MAKRRSPGEGSISRRPDGRWVGQIVTGAAGPGRPHRRTVYGKTKTELIGKLTRAKVELHGGMDAGRRVTFGQLAQLWLDNRESKIRWVTSQVYSRTLKKYGKPLWRRPLVSIKPLDLDAHMRALEQAGVPSTARRAYRERLRQVFRYAVTKRLLPLSPADSLDVPHHEPHPKDAWERAEVAAFLEAARENRLYPMFYLALATGLRVGELLALQWGDVDAAAGTLTVRHTWAPGPDGHHLSPPKTAKSIRTIPLAQDVLDVLTAWRDESSAVDGFVFPGEPGAPVSDSTVARELRQVAAEAGVRQLTMHGLRHTYATLALRAGVPIQVLSERLGHSRVSITMDVYVKVLAEQREAAALPLARLLAEPDAALMQHSGDTMQLEPN
jgi:integrase